MGFFSALFRNGGFLLALMAAVFAVALSGLGAQEAKLDDTLFLELRQGRVVIKLRPDLAPNHVSRIKELVRGGFYDGVAFWRVIDGFMAQTGDPTGTGHGGSGTNLDAEFSGAKHVRGVVSMARGDDPNSADSQFFIVFDESPWLDGKYTVWGEVTEGMEHIDAITKGTEESKGVVDKPDKIVSMRLAADAASTAAADGVAGGIVPAAGQED